MERVISCEERIRRAEEIYERRKRQNGIRLPTNAVNVKKDYTLFKKMTLQILICLIIYFIFYMIKYSNYIFSTTIIDTSRSFLEYDIPFEKYYKQVSTYYDENIKNFFVTNNIAEENVNKIEENVGLVEEKSINEINVEEQKQEEAVLSETEEENIELSQMEIDANDIKSKYSLIVPLNGIISSRFGPRTPTSIVSANHAGIDIAEDEGTVFVAAMSGTVTFVSGSGGYGNHIYIENDDVKTIYAHCSQIYVKEGDEIEQGQELGEVGQTRKCNRSTFTF